MSKLSECQLRAMVAKIEATVNSHEARPGTPRNVASLMKAQARLDKYRAELASVTARSQADERKAEAARPVAVPASQQLTRCSIAGCSSITPRHQPLCGFHAAQKAAAHETVRATMDEGRQPEPAPAGSAKHAPDAELLAQLRQLLTRYTLGTVLDCTWATARELFGSPEADSQAKADAEKKAKAEARKARQA